jgi:hypothetical protein
MSYEEWLIWREKYFEQERVRQWEKERAKEEDKD